MILGPVVPKFLKHVVAVECLSAGREFLAIRLWPGHYSIEVVVAAKLRV
jgi:hypothetical protein